MQVTWSMWQPTFKLWEYVGYASNRVYGGGYIQGRHTAAAAAVGRRGEENLMGAVTTDQAPIP